MTHARSMLDAHVDAPGHASAHAPTRARNTDTYYLSTTTMVSRAGLSVTLHAHIACLVNFLTNHTTLLN